MMLSLMEILVIMPIYFISKFVHSRSISSQTRAARDIIEVAQYKFFIKGVNVQTVFRRCGGQGDILSGKLIYVLNLIANPFRSNFTFFFLVISQRQIL